MAYIYKVQYLPRQNKFKVIGIEKQDKTIGSDDLENGFLYLDGEQLNRINPNNLIVPKNVTIY